MTSYDLLWPPGTWILESWQPSDPFFRWNHLIFFFLYCDPKRTSYGVIDRLGLRHPRNSDAVWTVKRNGLVQWTALTHLLGQGGLWV